MNGLSPSVPARDVKSLSRFRAGGFSAWVGRMRWCCCWIEEATAEEHGDRRRRELSRRLSIPTPIAPALLAVQGRTEEKQGGLAAHPSRGRGRTAEVGGGRGGGERPSTWRGGERGRDGESSSFLFLFVADSNR